MEKLDIIKNVVLALDNKKAEDIKVIDIAKLTIVSDYFVIASGNSSTQIKSLADEVEFKLKELGVSPYKVEGYKSENWIILDYSNVVVHIFHKTARSFYDLERLWADSNQIEITQFLSKEH